ncbi:unnamed protein product [Closterium sp. Naga37s-1]|nr:unnamed protein product [Closterium sp. Naga37s-1]
MEFFRDASDATRGLNLLESPRPFAGSTLVLPSVSVGNVGQLTVDLLLETLLQKQHQQKQQEQQQSQGGYSIARVGWLEEPNVLPCAGNDPYSVGGRGAGGMGLSAPGSLTTAMEVFLAVPKSQSTSPPFTDAFTIIQQRSPVALGRMEEFSRNLATWATSQAFSRVVVLSGADAQRRLPPQIDGDQFRFLLVDPSLPPPASPPSSSSPEPTQSASFSTSLLQSLGWKPLESCDPFGGLPSASSSLPTGADGSGTSTGERGNEGHMEPEQEEAVMAGEEGEEDPGPLRGGEWGPEQGLKWKAAFLRICIALRQNASLPFCRHPYSHLLLHQSLNLLEAWMVCIMTGQAFPLSTGVSPLLGATFQLLQQLLFPETAKAGPLRAALFGINGAPGKMGRAVAQSAIAADVPIVPFGLTGPGLPKERLTYNDDASVFVDVFPSNERDAVLAEARKEYPDLIVVDYTLPAAVNSNAEWYIANRVPFVMGTTGGDRAKLAADVEASRLHAVIAPQMGKQVVAFLAALETLAEQCPGAYAGYKLKVVESHQSSKVDTSGTAKEAVRCFQKLGVEYDVSMIEMVRDPSEQMARMGVPENYLNGHAFHTYHLDSPDNTVSFEFQHNVCGRSIYADGAIDAVLFLAQKIKEGDTSKTLFNMIDVLKAGSMR